MAKQVINRGTVAGDGTGESPFSGMGKANANFTELYDQDAVHLAAADPHLQYTTVARAAANATTLVANKAALPATGVSGVLYVTADNGYLWRWNGTTYVGAPFTVDASGNIVLTVLNQTNTIANLLTLSGGNGQIAVATDQNAIVVYRGGVTDGKADYRNRLVGKTTVVAATPIAGASGVWSAIDFTGGTVPEDDLSAANPTTLDITIPASVDYFEIIYNCPFKEAASATGVTRRVRATGGTITLNRMVSTAPNLANTTWPNTLQGFLPKTLTSGVAVPVVLQSYHDSAVAPTLTGGGNYPWMTVLMYRN